MKKFLILALIALLGGCSTVEKIPTYPWEPGSLSWRFLVDADSDKYYFYLKDNYLEFGSKEGEAYLSDLVDEAKGVYIRPKQGEALRQEILEIVKHSIENQHGE